MNDDRLTDAEQYLISDAVDGVLDGDEPPNMVESTRVAFLAVHRWSVDLQRGVGEQRYSAFPDVVADAADDVRAEHTVGVEVPIEQLIEDANLVVDLGEKYGDWDRNDPGGLVERVDAQEDSA